MGPGLLLAGPYPARPQAPFRRQPSHLPILPLLLLTLLTLALISAPKAAAVAAKAAAVALTAASLDTTLYTSKHFPSAHTHLSERALSTWAGRKLKDVQALPHVCPEVLGGSEDDRHAVDIVPTDTNPTTGARCVRKCNVAKVLSRNPSCAADASTVRMEVLKGSSALEFWPGRPGSKSSHAIPYLGTFNLHASDYLLRCDCDPAPTPSEQPGSSLSPASDVPDTCPPPSMADTSHYVDVVPSSIIAVRAPLCERRCNLAQLLADFPACPQDGSTLETYTLVGKSALSVWGPHLGHFMSTSKYLVKCFCVEAPSPSLPPLPPVEEDSLASTEQASTCPGVDPETFVDIIHTGWDASAKAELCARRCNVVRLLEANPDCPRDGSTVRRVELTGSAAQDAWLPYLGSFQTPTSSFLQSCTCDAAPSPELASNDPLVSQRAQATCQGLVHAGSKDKFNSVYVTLVRVDEATEQPVCGRRCDLVDVLTKNPTCPQDGSTLSMTLYSGSTARIKWTSFYGHFDEATSSYLDRCTCTPLAEPPPSPAPSPPPFPPPYKQVGARCPPVPPASLDEANNVLILPVGDEQRTSTQPCARVCNVGAVLRKNPQCPRDGSTVILDELAGDAALAVWPSYLGPFDQRSSRMLMGCSCKEAPEPALIMRQSQPMLEPVDPSPTTSCPAVPPGSADDKANIYLAAVERDTSTSSLVCVRRCNVLSVLQQNPSCPGDGSTIQESKLTGSEAEQLWKPYLGRFHSSAEFLVNCSCREASYGPGQPPGSSQQLQPGEGGSYHVVMDRSASDGGEDAAGRRQKSVLIGIISASVAALVLTLIIGLIWWCRQRGTPSANGGSPKGGGQAAILMTELSELTGPTDVSSSPKPSQHPFPKPSPCPSPKPSQQPSPIPNSHLDFNTAATREYTPHLPQSILPKDMGFAFIPAPEGAEESEDLAFTVSRAQNSFGSDSPIVSSSARPSAGGSGSHVSLGAVRRAFRSHSRQFGLMQGSITAGGPKRVKPPNRRRVHFPEDEKDAARCDTISLSLASWAEDDRRSFGRESAYSDNYYGSDYSVPASSVLEVGTHLDDEPPSVPGELGARGSAHTAYEGGT